MLKEKLLKRISDSKEQIKEYVSEQKLSEKEFGELILKILEGESLNIQKTINLYYLDKFSIKEISEILDIKEFVILEYFQLILCKIKLVLNKEQKKEKLYSVENFGKGNYKI